MVTAGPDPDRRNPADSAWTATSPRLMRTSHRIHLIPCPAVSVAVVIPEYAIGAFIAVDNAGALLSFFLPSHCSPDRDDSDGVNVTCGWHVTFRGPASLHRRSQEAQRGMAERSTCPPPPWREGAAAGRRSPRGAGCGRL